MDKREKNRSFYYIIRTKDTSEVLKMKPKKQSDQMT